MYDFEPDVSILFMQQFNYKVLIKRLSCTLCK